MWKSLALFPNVAACTLRNVPSLRQLSCSQILGLDQKWRRDKGLPLNPNASGALTDGPDYTFLDGRPTPYGSRQRNRILKQKEIAEKIISLTAEIDFAVDRHNKLQQQESENRKQILDSKLKPKGIELLRKNKRKGVEQV